MSVFAYKHDLSYTEAGRERPRKNDDVALSPSKDETRRRATTKTGEGDSAPHKHAVAARPSTGPAGAAVHALFKRTARRPHIIPQSEPTTSSHSKITLDAKESRKQGPPTKDPVQHRLVDPSTSYK